MSSVSLIIPAWNEERTLPLTLKALLKLRWLPERFEIIVVAGGSDDTVEVAKGLSETLNDLASYQVLVQKPEGKNAAIHAGIQASTNRIVVLLDADTIVSKHWLKRMTMPIEQGTCDLTIANPVPIKTSFVSEYYMTEKAYMLDSITTYSGHAMAFKSEDVVHCLDYFFPKHVKVGVDYCFARRFVQEGRLICFAKDALVATHLPSTFKFFLRDEQRWLSAYLDIDGINLTNLASHSVFLAALIFTVPLNGFLFFCTLLFHVIYIIRRIHIWIVASKRDEGHIGYLPGFLLLSYVHHIIGFYVHLRHVLGFSKQKWLHQGQRY